jgi:REP element-mobilizing transposase RayT
MRSPGGFHAGAVNRDHVHMVPSIPPSLSVSRAVQHLKGRSSHKLLSEFGILRCGLGDEVPASRSGRGRWATMPRTVA